MNASEHPRYVIISPVRDEKAYLPLTLQSVINQTVRPVEWLIVNDGSTDGTRELIQEYSGKHPWIRGIHRANRGRRKSGTGVMEAFYDGYKALASSDWDFLVKLDGDLSFPDDYLERCLQEFQREPQLGIAGGRLYHVLNGEREFEDGPLFHVRGATKIYRRECWTDMGGLWPGLGWDAIDDVNANRHGWRTRTLQHLEVFHHRPTGAADGAWSDRVKHGLVCYATGYHPMFVAASCGRRITQPPVIAGSIAILWGFIKGHLMRTPKITDPSYLTYIRQQQLRRLFGQESIWR